MKTRRIMALIFNLLGSCMTLLITGILACIFIYTMVLDDYSLLTMCLAGVSTALFGVPFALAIVNIHHFSRYAKKLSHKFDKNAIILGGLNVFEYVIIGIFYIIGVMQNDLGFSAASIIAGFVLLIGCILFCVAAIVLSVISIGKEKSAAGNA